jgi:hypothetical protein
MKYNYVTRDGKELKIGIYTAYFESLDPRFISYQKKVFDKFGVEINQILVEPNLLNRGFNSHGTLLTELSRNEDVDYLMFFDADAIPLKSNFIDIILDRIHGKRAIIGIEQRTNHVKDSIPYAGPACFAISKETYNELGQPAYNETPRSDVAEELTHIGREKGFEINVFKFSRCEVPLWELGDGRKFGTASTYEDLMFHNFESRNSEKVEYFIGKCKEVLEESDLHIAIHVMPYEIDQLEQLLLKLKTSSNYLSYSDKVVVDVLLNLNLVDWESSSLPKSFFINKFNQLEQLTKTWAITKFEINEDGTIQGCVSHRRKTYSSSNSEAVLILDTDVVFSETLLAHLIHSTKVLKEHSDYYILTPQITPMWDNSWDSLVNDSFKNDGINFRERDPYKYAKLLGDVSIKPTSNFKFGGGWATLISNSLVKKIEIPQSLGHYGLEDTYLMYCSEMLKQNGIDVTQYVLENEVIVEDNLFRYNPYKEYLVIINKQEEFKKIAHENFPNELKKFEDSLKR